MAGIALGVAVGGTDVSLANGVAVNVALAAGSVRGTVGETCVVGDNGWQAVKSKIRESKIFRIIPDYSSQFNSCENPKLLFIYQCFTLVK